jgi:Bacterial regulatory proteins, luxR family
LFLSPKTIEYHLRSVYRKLSVGSRSELKAALDRLTAGLPGPTGLQHLSQQGRGPRGAIGPHRRVVDRPGDLGDDGLGQILGAAPGPGCVDCAVIPALVSRRPAQDATAMDVMDALDASAERNVELVAQVGPEQWNIPRHVVNGVSGP